MSVDNGDEKLLAMARHIAKTLGHTDSMDDDEILHLFSTFDSRLSRENMSEKMNDDPGRRTSRAHLENSLKSLDRQILHFVSADHSIWSDSSDSATFLDAIDELLTTIREWSSMAGDKNVAACLLRAEDLMQQAMFRLEEEFRSLMEQGGEVFQKNRGSHGSFDSEDEGTIDGNDQIPIAHPISDYNIIIDALPSGTINDLHEIAKRMVAAGFGKECSHVYSNCRGDFIEESISRLGLQKLSIEEVQKMTWPDLEDQIERWIKAANVSLRILFPSERRLCDRIFLGFSSAADLSFMEVCRGCTIQLLNFADAVAIGSRAPERLFKVLDLFETLRDLMPDFEDLFSDEYCVLLTTEALNIWKRLGEAIRGILMELENLIRRDPAKTPISGGSLHPITRYVMNYLRAACRSRETLEQVFEESYTKVDQRTSPSSSPFSVQVDWIMELLESNLEAKSKTYRDPAFSCIFMMNNQKYIVEKVKDNELGSLLGEEWIRKHNAKVRQYIVNYQRSSWNKVLSVLKTENNYSPNAPLKSMKEKLKLFNSYFEETCRIQTTWIIFDPKFREEIRMSVAETLCPAYRDFLRRFKEEDAKADRYVKYSVEDIQARANNLFRSVSIS